MRVGAVRVRVGTEVVINNNTRLVPTTSLQTTASVVLPRDWRLLRFLTKFAFRDMFCLGRYVFISPIFDCLIKIPRLYDQGCRLTTFPITKYQRSLPANILPLSSHTPPCLALLCKFQTQHAVLKLANTVTQIPIPKILDYDNGSGKSRDLSRGLNRKSFSSLTTATLKALSNTDLESSHTRHANISSRPRYISNPGT